MSAYIIPPYLLKTSLGFKLHNELKQHDILLGKSNQILLDSPLFETKPEVPIVPPYNYSPNETINEIIKQKLAYKLEIIGVLGTSPKPVTEFSDEELFELFEIFKHRLLAEEPEDTEDTKRSLYAEKFGEISIHGSENDGKSQKYWKYSLKQLLLLSKWEINSQIGFKPSFLKFSPDEYFQYSLPSSWVSLVPSSMLGVLNRNMDLSTNHDDGYCNIELKTIYTPTVIETKPLMNSRYFNFVSNESITPSVGIFYYEAEIIQTCRDSTNLLPLLSIQDSSISTSQSPNCSVGFVKRFIAHKGKISADQGGGKLDLEKVKKELIFNQDNQINKNLSLATESIVGKKPGEFPGSFAIDLSDSYFYNASKLIDPRNSLLNRRSLQINNAEDNLGKIDTQISFCTNVASTLDAKRLNSDIIGVGINFIDKSVFLTLNGVLIKVVKDGLTSSVPNSDDLFSPDCEVYPIIGFVLNDIDVQSDNSTELKLKTNFGFKEFKFNINNYISEYKKKMNQNLNLNLLKYPDNKITLNDFLKDYLNTEGFIETYKRLNNDLNQLNGIIGEKEIYDTSLIENSDGVNRNLFKVYFQGYKFDEIFALLEKYSQVFNDEEGENIYFEIKLNRLFYKLREYINDLLVNGVLDESEYQQIWQLIKQLQKEYSHQTNKHKHKQLQAISVLILVKDERALANLPILKAMLNKLDQKMVSTFNKINQKILKFKQYEPVSNFERLIENVYSNINELNQRHDENYLLINLENDELNF